MYQPLFDRIEGELTADISAVATLLPVDPQTFTLINESLSGANWTYLLLQSPLYTEEVKVTGTSGAFLVVERGTSLSIPRAFYEGDLVTVSVNRDAVQDIISQTPQPSDLVIEGGGAAMVSQIGNNVTVTVDPPTFVGTDGIVVTGSYPAYSIAAELAGGGCCGDDGGSTGGGGVSQLEISGNFLQGMINGGTLQLILPPPNFTGTGITITGTWPNINFAVSGGGGGSGSGTVVGISVGSGLTLTGNPAVNPNISVTNTGVTPGDYGGLVVLATGQIEQIPAGFSPVSNVTIDNASVSRTGGTISIDLHDADVGQKGVVALAEYNGSIDGNDETTVLTPKYLKQAMQVGTLVAAGSNTGEADSLYNNPLSSTAVTVNLAAGEKAVFMGNVTILDSTTTPVVFGLALFNGSGSKITSNRQCAQSNQTIIGSLEGPYTGAVTLATTSLPSGANVQGAVLTYQKA